LVVGGEDNYGKTYEFFKERQQQGLWKYFFFFQKPNLNDNLFLNEAIFMYEAMFGFTFFSFGDKKYFWILQSLFPVGWENKIRTHVQYTGTIIYNRYKHPVFGKN